MTALTNSAEGGVSGTTITVANTGGTSGNAANAVTTPGTGGAVAQFDNTHANSGTLSYLFATGASGPATYFTWTSASLGTQSQVWFRIYLYLTANPAKTRHIWRATGTSGQCGVIGITTSGTVAFYGASNQQMIATSSTITLNQFVRIEGYLTGNATGGQAQIQLFNTASSTTPTQVVTSSASQRTGGSMNSWSYGQVFASGGNVVPDAWFDDIGLSSTGYLGPVQTSTTLTTPNIVLFAPALNPVVVPPPPIVPNFLAGFGPQQPDMQNLWVNPLTFFQQKMVFRARQTVTPTTLPSSGAVTTIIFDTIDEDPYSGWSSPSWTPPAGYNGWFQVTVTIRVTAPGHLQTVLAPYVNSPSTITGSGQMAGITLPQNDPGGAEGSFIIYLTGGQDSVTVAAAVENASANVTTSLVNGQQSSCEICWLGV